MSLWCNGNTLTRFPARFSAAMNSRDSFFSLCKTLKNRGTRISLTPCRTYRYDRAGWECDSCIIAPKRFSRFLRSCVQSPAQPLKWCQPSRPPVWQLFSKNRLWILSRETGTLFYRFLTQSLTEGHEELKLTDS
jgi:hypothetical protein